MDACCDSFLKSLSLPDGEQIISRNDQFQFAGLVLLCARLIHSQYDLCLQNATLVVGDPGDTCLNEFREPPGDLDVWSLNGDLQKELELYLSYYCIRKKT